MANLPVVSIPDEVRALFVAAVAIEDVGCLVVTFTTNKNIEIM